ncbi:murein hydrolase activator NlpD [Pantoea stewartii]|uniref:Peptidase n=1 Tax=Pantoea stewartii subsp. stewartii DC283 TaxID=660596 RepID=H3RGS8_PANSE|nr:murein hydrolase activator NlpD [Pantoea stewartii]ARF48817.1 peptidase [Pantoea stewartii subsp. stewartii DC283]EHT99268.1 putative outer membrane lipoprotein [Pantoea stewartii subsp. stewartii DC283]KAB0554663.1 murein hydrolase activator NlpD [Pantoea stewartii subsp. stewartii]
MSTGSTIFQLRRLAALSLVSFWLAGCSSGDNTQAPISNIGDGSSMNDNGNMASTGTAPVASGVPTTPSQGGMLSRNTPVPQNKPGIISTGNNTSNEVETQNGRIVYNRSYQNIPKGSYSGQTYTVKRGDTLFYIAWITGNDFRDLAQRNNVQPPYSLNVGQTLQVDNGSGQPITGGNAITAADASQSGIVTAPQIKQAPVAQQPVITYSDDSGNSNGSKLLPSKGANVATTTAPAVTAPPTVSSTTNSSTPVGSWRWPTEGKIIDNFSATEGGNKGIDIAGSRGQPVVATASGRVVYAGNALRGYGNLIIIKHNDDYLSAYAHNDTMLVREQQEVKAGQKIATMGSTGTSSVRLHFEIRFKGKSVNPLRYLPQR